MGAIMTNHTDSLLHEIVDEMKTIYKDSLISVILFGSYARGDFDLESDVDVMVVIDVHASEISVNRANVNKIASRLSLKSENCTTVCILLQDLTTFNKYKNYQTFLSNIISEGVTIYAA
jgi:predicted nucleotidyltransferase